MTDPFRTVPQQIAAGQPIGAAMLLDIISEARSAMLEAAAMRRRADQAIQAFARQQGQPFMREAEAARLAQQQLGQALAYRMGA